MKEITVNTTVGELVPEGDSCYIRDEDGNVVTTCPFFRQDEEGCECSLTQCGLRYDYDKNVRKKCEACLKPPSEVKEKK